MTLLQSNAFRCCFSFSGANKTNPPKCLKMCGCAQSDTNSKTRPRLGSCPGMFDGTPSGLPDTIDKERPGKVKLSPEEWKAKLSSQQFFICRKQGTEMPWTGALLFKKTKGKYICACCNAELFASAAKFDSGSGWPSFSDTLADKDLRSLPAVNTVTGRSAGLIRTEVLCGKCDAHLGYVFNDGPKPTGLRFCVNSVALKFVPLN